MTFIRTIIIIFTFTSCTDTIDKDELVGRYVMSNDTLEILSNNTYRHIFNNQVNCSTWTLSSTGNEVAFDNFTFNPDNGHGVWHSRIILTNDEIHLNVNSDLKDGYFNKVNDR